MNRDFVNCNLLSLFLSLYIFNFFVLFLFFSVCVLYVLHNWAINETKTKNKQTINQKKIVNKKNQCECVACMCISFCFVWFVHSFISGILIRNFIYMELNQSTKAYAYTYTHTEEPVNLWKEVWRSVQCMIVTLVAHIL